MRHELVIALADMMMSGRSLLGPDAPSEEDSRLIALTISGSIDVSAMWLRGDIDIDRERLIDFMTALALSSVRLPAALL